MTYINDFTASLWACEAASLLLPVCLTGSLADHWLEMGIESWFIASAQLLTMTSCFTVSVSREARKVMFIVTEE